MIEVAVVFDPLGRAIKWHGPDGSSGGSIPDSRELWDVLWKNRHHLGGVAHTHPWDGPGHPSHTDITTYQAVESGLGRWCVWPVVTMTEVGYYVLDPQTREPVQWDNPFNHNPFWPDTVRELRRLTALTGR